MDYKAIYLGMGSTIKTLFSALPIKLAGSAALALLLHRHAILFYAFAFLVFLDCFTRWMSISYGRLVSRGKEQPSGCVERYQSSKKRGNDFF